jgi:hypothetical protein
VPETIVFAERLFMRLIKGSLAGLVLAGILAILPAAAFAHGGGGGGGGHGFGGGGGGHAFFGRGDHGRFADRGFSGRDRDFRDHRRFFVGFDFVGFGFPDWWYPDYYYYGDYAYPYDYPSYDNSAVYDYRYWYGLASAVQTDLARRGYYHGPIDGVIGFGSREAIRAFQEAQGLPATALIDPALLKALKLPAVPAYS